MYTKKNKTNWNIYLDGKYFRFKIKIWSVCTEYYINDTRFWTFFWIINISDTFNILNMPISHCTWAFFFKIIVGIWAPSLGETYQLSNLLNTLSTLDCNSCLVTQKMRPSQNEFLVILIGQGCLVNFQLFWEIFWTFVYFNIGFHPNSCHKYCSKLV